MLTRREYLMYSALAGAACTLPVGLVQALEAGDIIKRAIPKTGEELPIVGLGSSATFRTVAQSDDVTALQGVLQTLVENGGTVFDTAPGYGASEEVAGQIVQDLGLQEKMFWATKVNVAPRGGGSADPAAARAQIDRSFEYIGKDPIDLIQVHNLGDVPTQLPILRDFKRQGRVRYVGVTTTFDQQYDDLLRIMRNESLDFIGIDYAVDNRDVEETILPLAAERKIAVMVYVPFGRTRLWQRIEGQELPPWAAEFDAETWAQFFIKYVLSHPAVTVVTPATSKANHMLDNIGGGIGRLPNDTMRRRMAEFVDALPPAPPRNR